MKFRTILLASAAVMFAGSAMAADLTNPFYTPSEGKFTSDTAVSHSRDKLKHHAGVDKATMLSEEVAYGITDQLAVLGTIVNHFDANNGYNNDHNFEYNLGVNYNMRDGNVLSQVAAGYTTWNPKDFYGKRNVQGQEGRWQKVLNAELKLGYDMGDGLTPYVTYGVEGNVDASDRYLLQTVKAGVHKYTGEWAFGGAVRYEFETDGHNTNEWWLDANVDYDLTENMALGVYGSYFLDGTGSHETDYNYEAGAHLKVLF